MDNKKKICSLKEHSGIEAVLFCQECNLYMCNKCDNFHSKLFVNHHKYKIDQDLQQLFTGFCKEEKHSNELKYFCKTHNVLCCAACLSKIKDKDYGQHKDCEVCNMEDIINAKKDILDKNVQFLQNIINNIYNSIRELKKI